MLGEVIMRRMIVDDKQKMREALINCSGYLEGIIVATKHLGLDVNVEPAERLLAQVDEALGKEGAAPTKP